MEAEPLICPRCGADLDVPDGVEIFRCQYCGSKCQVKTSGSVRGLALLEAGMQKVVQHTERSADGIEQLVASAQSQELARKKAHANWQSKLAELESRRRSANSAAATCLFLGFTIPVASCASFGFFIKSQGGGLFVLGMCGFVGSIFLLLFASHFSQKAKRLEQDVSNWSSREPL